MLGAIDSPVSVVPGVITAEHALEVEVKAVLESSAHTVAAFYALHECGQIVDLFSEDILNFFGGNLLVEL